MSAKLSSITANTTQLARGTTGYRAPELCREEATFTTKVDIWALGCILYEVAVGKKVFPSDFDTREYAAAKRMLPISLPSSIDEDVQSPLSNLIREMLRINPKDRPSAEELNKLFGILTDIGPSAFTLKMEDTLMSKICQPWCSEIKEDDVSSITDYAKGRLVKSRLNPEWVSAPGGQRWTPLHFAAWHNDSDMIKTLVSGGAMLSPQNMDGWTPLYLAVERGSLDAVRILLRAQADTSIGDHNGLTAMHRAAFFGHVDIIKGLVEAGANVSVRSNNGSCPLHWAAVGGRTAAIKCLIDARADIDAKEEGGFTPLHRAAALGHLEIVEALLAAKADVFARNDVGATPLHWAAVHGYLSIVESLVKAGADISVRENAGWTPLHRARTFGHVDVIRMLVRNGANISVKDWAAIVMRRDTRKELSTSP
jgi:ankyrin repeat protein